VVLTAFYCALDAFVDIHNVYLLIKSLHRLVWLFQFKIFKLMKIVFKNNWRAWKNMVKYEIGESLLFVPKK